MTLRTLLLPRQVFPFNWPLKGHSATLAGPLLQGAEETPRTSELHEPLPLITGYKSPLVRAILNRAGIPREHTDVEFGRKRDAESKVNVKVSVAPSTAEVVQCHQSADSRLQVPLRGDEVVQTEYWSLPLAGWEVSCAVAPIPFGTWKLLLPSLHSTLLLWSLGA